jgi:hypothetical protein
VPRIRALTNNTVSTPKRATRHSGHAFRKLQAQPQSRFVVHDPPQPDRPALAPGTAPLALRNARLPKDDPRFTTLPRPRAPAPKRATRHSGTAQPTPLRRLHGVARSAPQRRLVVHHLRNSRSTGRTGAPGTASPGLSNARLFAWSGRPAVL